MKLYRFLTMIVLVGMLLNGCAATPSRNQRVLNVGMILARGGLGDRSFNDSAYAGLQEAQKEYGIRFETIDWVSEEANLEAVRRLAQQKYDLVIGVGFENVKSIQTAAAEFPDTHFAIIDSTIEASNITSFIYREQEGDFLMGVLAATLTKSKKVGFIGGADMDITRRIESGFKQGVAYQDSTVEVISELAGTFTDAEKGKAIALKQYEAGVDVIYNGAGRTGLGIIEAAKEKNQLTIGASGDQRYLAPGNVVGNRPKRVDTAVLTLIKEILNDKFQSGTRSLGLKEGGLSLGPFDPNIVNAQTLQRLEDLKQKIIAGEIAVK
jgi:basic membrane protein A